MRLNSMQALSHLNPDSNIFVSLPCTIWTPSRSFHHILVPIFIFHSFQVTFPLHPSFNICGSLPSRHHLPPIQSWRCKAHLNLCPISCSSRPLSFISHFHPSRTSRQCRSWCLCLTSIHVTSQLHPVPQKCYLSSIQTSSQTYPTAFYMCLTISVLYQLHPGHKLIV